MRKVALILIRLYQYTLSPFLRNNFGGGCRFDVSCSKYAYQVIEKYGFTKGLFLSSKRIISCNPWLKPLPNQYK